MNKDKTGWILSAALHVGIAAVALIGLPSLVRERPGPPPPVAIEFVKIAEKTQVEAPKEEEPQEEAAIETKPQYAKAEQVEAPAPEAVPLPEPKPVIKEEPKPAPKPKPKPEVTEREKLRKRITVQTKPKPPSRLKSDRIAALIDKSLKDDTAQKKAEKKKEEKQESKKEEKKPDLFAGLRGRIATASLMDALRQKVESCWSFPRGAKGIDDMSVMVRIWLLPDGQLARQPEFVNAGDLNDPDRAYFRTFAESARRAVQLCAPYSEAADYLKKSGQQYINFNFNPSEFAGG